MIHVNGEVRLRCVGMSAGSRSSRVLEWSEYMCVYGSNGSFAEMCVELYITDEEEKCKVAFHRRSEINSIAIAVCNSPRSSTHI